MNILYYIYVLTELLKDVLRKKQFVLQVSGKKDHVDCNENKIQGSKRNRNKVQLYHCDRDRIANVYYLRTIM